MRHGFPARTRAIPIFSTATAQPGGIEVASDTKNKLCSTRRLVPARGRASFRPEVPIASACPSLPVDRLWPLAETPRLARVRHAARREVVGCGVVEFLSFFPRFSLKITPKKLHKNST